MTKHQHNNTNPLSVASGHVERTGGNDYKKLDHVFSCFFCKRKTNYLLYLKDDSEIPACQKCLWSEGKIKKFRKFNDNVASSEKQAILERDYTGNNGHSSIIKEVKDGS